LIFQFAQGFLYGQQINIGLWRDKIVNAFTVDIIKGNYLLTLNDRAFEVINSGNILYVSLINDSILVAGKDRIYGKYAIMALKAGRDSSEMLIKPVDPSLTGRRYIGNINLNVKWKKLQVILNTDMDTYIDGVVEAEGGVKASIEYYKTQAVLCRTYALNHYDRHAEEGFNLCDGVHCQAFQGLVTQNQLIAKAAFSTSSLVVIDSDSTLITAAFHSNCGGETESSANLWKLPKDYLKPVKDPYCVNQKQSTWEQKVSWDKWKDYLKQNGFKISDDTPRALYSQMAFKRRQYYKINNDSIAMKKIRTDFGFKSSFFTVQPEKDRVIIKGRGYGHGVGLCQEGAMQMALLNYSYTDIIKFYYQGTSITDFHNLSPAKNKTFEMIFGH